MSIVPSADGPAAARSSRLGGAGVPLQRRTRPWRDRIQRVSPGPVGPALGLRPGDAVLVVTAHPGDETLGLGSTVAALAAGGVDVHLLCGSATEVSDGETTLDRRLADLDQAWATLDGGAMEVLGLPRGRLREHREALGTAVEDHLTRWPGVRRVLSVWERDPHPDHQAVGRASRWAARHVGRPVHGFPVWAYHRSDPAAVLPPEASLLLPSVEPGAAQRRAAALACYGTLPSPRFAGMDPVPPAEVADWCTELLVRM